METLVDLRIDFGNSETRVDFIYAGRLYRFKMPNRFGEVKQGERINKRYHNNLTTILQVDGKVFCNGRIVEQEYSHDALRPDSLSSKVEQDVTYISLRLAIAKTYMIISRVTGVAVKDLRLDFAVSALLPPINMDSQSKDFSEKIKAIKHVEILSPEFVTVNFNITKADIFSEGVAAFTGVFYKEINRIPIDNSEATELGYYVYDSGSQVQIVEVEENAQYAEGYVIVFDIGAGTTDVSIFRNFELIDKSKETFNIGGNLVNSELDHKFREKYGYRAHDEALLKAVLTGVLEEGKHERHVDADVLSAKDAYAKKLNAEVRKYLERIGIDVKSISGILVCGGGAEPSVRDGVEVVPPMSYLLLEYLKKLAPRIGLLHAEGSLREANIDGLHVLAKYGG